MATPTATSIRVNGRAAAPPAQPELRIEVMLVTPDMAANWLARGGKNRHISQRRVNILTAAIRRGEWQLTGEAIKLDGDGQVRDGQHRLSAVVKAGVPIQSVVVRNVDEAAFDVMDTGRSRQASDVLGIRGYASTTATAGAARLLVCFERFGRFYLHTTESEQALSTPVILKYVEEHDDLINGVRMADRIRGARVQGGVSTWGACLTLFLRINAEQAYQFCHLLVTGEDMSAGHPVLTLRNRMLFTRQDRATMNPRARNELPALVIKAWNAFREGRKLQVLVYREEGPRPESFPKPV